MELLINFNDRQITMTKALSMNKDILLAGMINSLKLRMEEKMCGKNPDNCKHKMLCDGCGKSLTTCETDHVNCRTYCRKLKVEGHYNLDGGSFCVDCWKAGTQWQWRSDKIKKEMEEKNDPSKVSSL